MSCLMDFLELVDVSDLSALDEHALTYASLHKPQRGQQGHFGLMDICRFRHVMELCNYPYFNITPNAPTTTQTYSHDIPFVSGTATTPMSHVLDSHHHQSSSTSSQSTPSLLLPCPLHTTPSCGEQHTFRTPIIDTITHKAQWTLVKTVDISERLQAHLGDDRHYYNGLEYYKHEWPIVLKLLWPHICADTNFDCFWNWRDPTPVPCKLNWQKSAASYPPSGNASFGVVYCCDFWTTCGCPKKLKVLRTATCPFIFQLHVQNVPTRHGCIHTIAKDKTSSTGSKGTIPTLHPGLQAFLRRQSLNHDSSSNLTWGDVAEKTTHYILHASFMHCSLPHLLPSASSGRDYRSQCKHPHILSLLRATGAYTANRPLLPEPTIVEVSTKKKGETRRQYSDEFHSVAPLVLEDGHTLLGCHAFVQPVAEQCRDFLRECNIRFHGQTDGPENSRLDILHDDFSKRNLYIDFQHALQQHGKLDLFRFNVIGYCYSIQPPNVTSKTSAPSNTPPRYLSHSSLLYSLFLACISFTAPTQ
jgi:hypothetical protein